MAKQHAIMVDASFQHDGSWGDYIRQIAREALTLARCVSKAACACGSGGALTNDDTPDCLVDVAHCSAYADSNSAYANEPGARGGEWRRDGSERGSTPGIPNVKRLPPSMGSAEVRSERSAPPKWEFEEEKPGDAWGHFWHRQLPRVAGENSVVSLLSSVAAPVAPKVRPVSLDVASERSPVVSTRHPADQSPMTRPLLKLAVSSPTTSPLSTALSTGGGMGRATSGPMLRSLSQVPKKPEAGHHEPPAFPEGTSAEFAPKPSLEEAALLDKLLIEELAAARFSQRVSRLPSGEYAFGSKRTSLSIQDGVAVISNDGVTFQTLKAFLAEFEGALGHRTERTERTDDAVATLPGQLSPMKAIDKPIEGPLDGAKISSTDVHGVQRPLPIVSQSTASTSSVFPSPSSTHLLPMQQSHGTGTSTNVMILDQLSPRSEGEQSGTCGSPSRRQQDVLGLLCPPQRAVMMGGFKNLALNALFVERPGDAYRIGGRETYWSEKGDYLLFYNDATSSWGLEKSRRLHQVRQGKSGGIAVSRNSYDIVSAPYREGWSEFDKETSAWVQRPGAGIVQRGKARLTPRSKPPSSTASPVPSCASPMPMMPPVFH